MTGDARKISALVGILALVVLALGSVAAPLAAAAQQVAKVYRIGALLISASPTST